MALPRFLDDGRICLSKRSIVIAVPALARAYQTFNTGVFRLAFRGRLALTATYERVRTGAAETKWKPNGNIAASTDSAISVTT